MATLSLITGLRFRFDRQRDLPGLARWAQEWGMNPRFSDVRVRQPGWSATFDSVAGPVRLRAEDLDALWNSRFEIVLPTVLLDPEDGSIPPHRFAVVDDGVLAMLPLMVPPIVFRPNSPEAKMREITSAWFDGDTPNRLHPRGVTIDPAARRVYVPHDVGRTMVRVARDSIHLVDGLFSEHRGWVGKVGDFVVMDGARRVPTLRQMWRD